MIIGKEHLLLVLKAAELLYKGVDISKIETIYDFKQILINNKGKLVKKVTPLVEDFVIQLDNIDVCSYSFRNAKIKRVGRSYAYATESDTANLTLNSEKFKQIVRTIYNLYKIYGSLSRIYYDEEYEKEFNSFNRFGSVPEKFIELLSKDKIRENFRILTSVIYNSMPNLKCELLEAFEKDYEHFNIEGFEDKPVIDNRLFIKMRTDEKTYNEEYLVISKNLYDYYWASQGSAIQSCYSLTSEHHGLFGMIPFGIADGHYIVYTTKDTPNEYSLIPGTKWKVPFMRMRRWAWTDEEGCLVLDKLYGDDTLVFREYLSEVFPTKICSLDADLSREMIRIFRTYDARWYPDSIVNLHRTDVENVSFDYGDGKREFIGCARPCKGTMAQMFKNITTIEQCIEYEQNVEEVDGVLCNTVVCPYTGIKVPKSVGESPYAKHFKKHPVKSLVVMSYVDGYIRGVTSSINTDGGSVLFSEDRFRTDFCDLLFLGKTTAHRVSLHKLKSFLDANKSAFNFDALLLKCVDGDRISYIKYLRG